MRFSLPAIIAITLLTAPLSAIAHSGNTGHEHESGVVAGLLHPLTGTDHLLAMVAVGLWAGFVMPHRVFVAPLVFMISMGGGALLGWIGIGVPLVEPGILLSVVILGLMTLACGEQQSSTFTRISLLCIALFAVLHGYAHATEASGHIGAYLAGFMASTAILHSLGVLMALAIARSDGARWIQRASGVAITAGGALLLFGSV